MSQTPIIPKRLTTDRFVYLLYATESSMHKDNPSSTATNADLSAHTPMMQQYLRLTFS